MVSSHLSDQQSWDAASYARNARFVADHAGEVVAWLALKSGERVLDLGCGDGALTEGLVAQGATVVGVDVSDNLLAAALARGLDVRKADARALPFHEEFDAVFSNAVLHWVREPDVAARSIYEALKPGGRFVAEFGGHGNVAAVTTALRAAALIHGGSTDLAAPWFYPTTGEYRSILQNSGFNVPRIGLFPRPTPLPTGMDGWLDTFRKPFFDQFAPDRRVKVRADVIALLKPALCDTLGNWTADYVRLRVAATKPS
jgi:SAM-dependent methyltransferase